MKKTNGRSFKVTCEKGYYVFKLEKLLKENNMSKYSLAKLLNTEYKVINRYSHGNLTKFNSKVIARICNACNCRIEDFLEYVNEEEEMILNNKEKV